MSKDGEMLSGNIQPDIFLSRTMMVEFIVFWVFVVGNDYVERRQSFRTNKAAGVCLNLIRKDGVDASMCGIDYVVDGETLDTYDPDDGCWEGV